MSGNDEDKCEANKAFPLDLASKITVKSAEVPKGTQLVMTAQPLRRVLTQTGAANVSTGATSVTGQTISIVPQAIIKQGIISSHGQTQAQAAGLTVARPAQITLATSVVGQSQAGSTTYHVPRGPAVVANLATPRSAVATPIRAQGVATTPPGQPSTGFVTAVRQVTPSRTPSPANSALPAGTAWLSSTGMQVQSGGQIKSVVSSVGSGNSGVVTSGNTTLTANLQRIPPSSGGNAPAISRTQIVARAQSNTVAAASTAPRQAVLHSAITIGQTNPQIHSFKPAAGIQTIGSAVTLAQVLPTRTQTLVYSAGNNQHFTASPRIAVTGAMNTQRQVTAARPAQVMATRLAVPVSVSQGSTRLTVTPGQGTLYTTGARLSAVPAQTQNTVIGTPNTRIAVSNSQQQPTVGRLSVSSPPGALLTTTQARLTVANPAQQPPSAVVIGTQTGRLAASVVSLHPVVVANPSQTARTIQTQGPKVITQPAQGPAIQLAQVPAVTKLPQQQVVPVTVAVAAPTTRTINVTPATIVSQRPVAITSGTQAIPIAKVFPQGNRVALETEGSNPISQSSQPANVYIHAAPMVRRATSPGPANSGQTETQRTPVTTYSLSGGTTYYYEAASSYTVAGGNLVATRPFTPSSGSFAAVPQSANTQIRTTGIATQVHGIMSGQPIQFNPVMVVGQKSSNQFMETGNTGGLLQQSPTPAQQQDQGNPLPSIVKVTSSPRPSILRKRDNEGSPLKAAKNLAPVLANLSSAPASPPSRPDSRGHGGNSSGGSTTISATSSPGLGEHGDDSLPLPPVQTPPTAAAVAHKLQQQQQQQQQQEEDRPTPEMSPRKKPRKQQLIGNDEPKFNMEDMQFLSENKIKKEPEDNSIPSRELVHESRNNNEVTVKKPAPASLLNSYRQTWKSTHNHYLRYTDVKPKDERRPTIIDLANQSQVLQKINGWKIHHLSAQMEDMSDLETQVYDKLSSMLKLIETKDCSGYDKEFNRINELIKGNMQRSKIINDSTIEAKTQVMKIFDHREHVADIINRCASKRNFKKRDKC